MLPVRSPLPNRTHPMTTLPRSFRDASRRNAGRYGLSYALLLFSLGLAAPSFGQITVTNAGDSGPGSLRQAVADAPADGTITFDASIGTIMLTTGEIVIEKNLTIDGSSLAAPVVLSGTNNSRIFNVLPGTTVTLTALAFTLGRADDGDDEPTGGALFNKGTLTVTRCTFSNNYALAEGGAIKNNGALTLSQSTLSGNSAGLFGGGLINWGTAEVNSSTLSGNSSANQAGGIYNRGMLTVNNSTLSGNSASYYNGIMNGGPATIRNSTIVGPGTQLYSEHTLHLSNTIMDDTADTAEVDCENQGTLTTNVSNLIADGSCSAAYSGDPLLGPLADNGGLTWTHLPLAGSPVLDRGDAATCAALPGGDVDQRGLARADGDGDTAAQCDIGAVEAQMDELPVELVSFTALASGADVLLHWTTASETNNAGFEVERMDAQTWMRLAFVEGHGTTAEAQSYGYRLEGLAPGAYRFRLKQIDHDGGARYSPEAEVTVELAEAFVLSGAYPNPFNPRTTFTLSVAQAQHVEVAVFDVLGRQVARLFDGPMEAGQAQVLDFDGAGLASGTYVIAVSGERFAARQTVVLLK